MKYLKIFISAVMAGICIGIGGIVFLSLDNRVLGALFFSVGLFTICSFKLNLFTGKVCYVFQNNRSYAGNLVLIWLGNLLGTGITALAVKTTRIASVEEGALSLCRTKLGDSLLSLFVLGIFCNIMIYIAVEGFRNHDHEIGKYLALIFGVMVFILCGFEHCIADMFYFSMAGVWDLHAVACILVISTGNAVGGILFPCVRAWLDGD